MVEIEHLQADVKRLLSMLKQTKEYQQFAECAEDINKQIRFLKDIKIKSPIDIRSCCQHCQNTRNCKELEKWAIDEQMLWVPEEAFKYAHQFRVKYQGELTDTLIEDLLFELNKIWYKREQKHIERIKKQSAIELNSVKRSTAYNPKFNEHQAKEEIKRLKGQLKQAYKENREQFSKANRQPQGMEYVNEVLRTNASNKRAAAQTIKTAQQQLQLGILNEQEEKKFFMDGAI